MKTGIIPAGGLAQRWDGFPKELLNVGSAWTLLDRMLLLQTRALTDNVVIVSSEAKYDLHKWWVHDHRKWPLVTILKSRGGVMPAIKAAIASNGKSDWVFGFPDTYTDIPLYPEEIEKPLMLGVFETNRPERFGMVRGDKIVDKEPGPDGEAYGAFMFNSDVADFWTRGKFDDHTDMLSKTMKKFEWGTWPIEIYHDVATMADYLDLLGGLYNAKEQRPDSSPHGK